MMLPVITIDGDYDACSPGRKASLNNWSVIYGSVIAGDEDVYSYSLYK